MHRTRFIRPEPRTGHSGGVPCPLPPVRTGGGDIRLAGLSLVLALAALLALAPAAAAGAAQAPRLVFEAEPGAEGERRQLEQMAPERLEGALALTGLEDGGGPIRVRVVPESSPLARTTPRWIAGFASGTSGPVVLFPARAGHYPYDSLEELLQHEVAHVLINRAAAGRPVPRWLHEGIAMTAGERWGLEDRSRFALEVARGGRVELASLDRLFGGSSGDVRRAYAVAGGFVNQLLRDHGPAVTGALLAGLGQGLSMEEAFHRATGESLHEAQARFWKRQTLWHRWLPLITSSTVLWIGVTLLALMAIRRRRQRDDELEERWEEEDRARTAATVPAAQPPGSRWSDSGGPTRWSGTAADEADAGTGEDEPRREWIH